MKSIVKKHTSQNLPCTLTDKERLDLADELAQVAKATKQAEINKKSATSELKSHQAHHEKLASTVATGIEYRDVAIEEQLDYAKGSFKAIRTDTGEVITERSMTALESQTNLIDHGDKV